MFECYNCNWVIEKDQFICQRCQQDGISIISIKNAKTKFKFKDSDLEHIEQIHTGRHWKFSTDKWVKSENTTFLWVKDIMDYLGIIADRDAKNNAIYDKYKGDWETYLEKLKDHITKRSGFKEMLLDCVTKNGIDLNSEPKGVKDGIMSEIDMLVNGFDSKNDIMAEVENNIQKVKFKRDRLYSRIEKEKVVDDLLKGVSESHVQKVKNGTYFDQFLSGSVTYDNMKYFCDKKIDELKRQDDMRESIIQGINKEFKLKRDRKVGLDLLETYSLEKSWNRTDAQIIKNIIDEIIIKIRIQNLVKQKQKKH